MIKKIFSKGRFRKFGPPIANFLVKVSGNLEFPYDSDFQINEFVQNAEYLDLLKTIHPCFNSENFLETSNKMKEGEAYNVKIFPILTKVTATECFQFLKNKDAVLVGAQGLTLALEQKCKEMPLYTWIVSLDEAEALPTKNFLFCRRHLAPRAKLTLESESDRILISLKCISIERGFNPHRCLLAFFKL